jgi:hypothetical protein
MLLCCFCIIVVPFKNAFRAKYVLRAVVYGLCKNKILTKSSYHEEILYNSRNLAPIYYAYEMSINQLTNAFHWFYAGSTGKSYSVFERSFHRSCFYALLSTPNEHSRRMREVSL